MTYMIFLLKSAVHAGSRKPCSRCPFTAINVLFSNSSNVDLWTPPILQDECAVGLMDKPAGIYPAYYGTRRRRP